MSIITEHLTRGEFAEIWIQRTYRKDIPEDIDAFRDILEKWSGIPRPEQDAWLTKIRDSAWEVHKYPCLGRWSFTSLAITKAAEFKEAVERLKVPNCTDRFIDVGCGLGQIPRQLAHQGIPTKFLYGLDLLEEFIELGYELFRDQDKWPRGRFVASDLLQPSPKTVEWLGDKFTIVHSSNLFHLFDLAKQHQLAVRIIELLRKQASDVVIFGGMIGKREPAPAARRRGGGVYLHDINSFQRVWDEAGEETETKWKVEAVWLSNRIPDIPGFPEDCRYMYYSIRRG